MLDQLIPRNTARPLSVATSNRLPSANMIPGGRAGRQLPPLLHIAGIKLAGLEERQLFGVADIDGLGVRGDPENRQGAGGLVERGELVALGGVEVSRRRQHDAATMHTTIHEALFRQFRPAVLAEAPQAFLRKSIQSTLERLQSLYRAFRSSGRDERIPLEPLHAVLRAHIKHVLKHRCRQKRFFRLQPSLDLLQVNVISDRCPLWVLGNRQFGLGGGSEAERGQDQPCTANTLFIGSGY